MLKKILFIFIISISGFFSISCNRNPKTEITKKSNFKSTDTVLVKVENQLIKEFKIYIDSLDSANATSALMATEKYKLLFKGKSKGLCDTAFVFFQNLMDTLLIVQNNQLENDTTNFDAFIRGESTSKKITDFNNSLMKKGFILKSQHDFVFIDLNYDFILVNFLPFVSEPMNQFLTEMMYENTEGFAHNDSIKISPETLVNRVLWYENFITQNNSFVFSEKCKNYRKAYLTYLLTGYNKTTLFANTQSHEISTYFATAFEYLISKYPESETAALTLPYYEAIKQKNINTSNEILKKYVIRGLIYNLR